LRSGGDFEGRACIEQANLESHIPGRERGEVHLFASHRSHPGKWRALVVLALSPLALAATTGTAGAASLAHGGVFTETNTAPNYVLAYAHKAGGALALVAKVKTGGNGRTSNNPPSGFPALDSSGAVGLGTGNTCLFAVNAGSSTVSSFRVTSKGLKLVNHRSSGGTRPDSLTSHPLGHGKQLLYVLNSDTHSASIHGFTVSPSCRLTSIPKSTRPTSSQNSVPAQIRFDVHGKVLAVSERFANDIDIFPVKANGRTKPPVVHASKEATPYGLDWNNKDILSVSNEHLPLPDVANSTVTTYSLKSNGKLVALATAPSPGAACWNVFTNNGKILFVTNPAGVRIGANSVLSFRVGRHGSLTAVDKQDTTYNALDDALTRDNGYLYILNDQLLPVPGPHSAIDRFKVNVATGVFTPAGSTPIAGNTTSGLAAF
jgi:6-phosphogluconolactonase